MAGADRWRLTRPTRQQHDRSAQFASPKAPNSRLDQQDLAEGHYHHADALFRFDATVCRGCLLEGEHLIDHGA